MAVNPTRKTWPYAAAGALLLLAVVVARFGDQEEGSNAILILGTFGLLVGGLVGAFIGGLVNDKRGKG